MYFKVTAANNVMKKLRMTNNCSESKYGAAGKILNVMHSLPCKLQLFDLVEGREWVRKQLFTQPRKY